VTSGLPPDAPTDVYDAYVEYVPEEPPDSERGLDLPAILALRSKQGVPPSPAPLSQPSSVIEGDKPPVASVTPSPSQSVAPALPKSNRTTTHDCRRIGAWGDVCVYSDMCYDGTYLYYFSPGEPCVGHTGTCRTVYNDGDIMEGIILPQHDVADVNIKPVPFNGGIHRLICRDVPLQ
jgi:hypothetical protein